jgi:hypothetical protein
MVEANGGRGAKAMRHQPSLTPPEQAKRLASYAARDCQAHSRRVARLLALVWQGFDSEEGKPHPEEVQNLLASVDAAAETAREMLAAMGCTRDVRKWQRKSEAYRDVEQNGAG